MGFTWGELDQMAPKDRWRHPLPPTCSKCDYDLRGLPEDRCPECGTPFRWDEVRRRTTRIWNLTLRLRHANKDATFAITIGLVNWFLMGFFRLLGWDSFYPLIAIITFCGGVISIILGSQVLNIRRVPKWARPYVCDPPPNIWLGAGAMLLGFVQMAGAIVLPA